MSETDSEDVEKEASIYYSEIKSALGSSLSALLILSATFLSQGSEVSQTLIFQG